MKCETVTHNGVEYRHVPAENVGFCGSCDYLDVHGDSCPKGQAPCREETVMRRVKAQQEGGE